MSNFIFLKKQTKTLHWPWKPAQSTHFDIAFSVGMGGRYNGREPDSLGGRRRNAGAALQEGWDWWWGNQKSVGLGG